MKYIYLLFILFISVQVAGAKNTLKDAADEEAKDVEYRFALGVQLGTDIGGAIPFPFKHIPSTFNPYPKLTPSIGVKLTFPVMRDWTLGAELTYKRVAIDADARIKDQKFDNEDNIIALFTGSAEMRMDFMMLELPVYFKYTFKNQNDRLLAGFYWSRIMKSKFGITVNKGFMMDEDGNYDAPIDPEKPLDINFNDILDTWDSGMIIGYERRLFSRIELGMRFSWGFKDIFKKDNQYFDYKMLHMRGTLVISYNLFNIKTPFKK